MTTEKEMFEKFLIRKNLRDTPQRGLILDEFLKLEEHMLAAAKKIPKSAYVVRCGRVFRREAFMRGAIPSVQLTY